MRKLIKKINRAYFKKINYFIFLLFIFLLPTQLGKHFFPSFSYLNGIRVDYLSPTIYLTDILVIFLLTLNFKKIATVFKNKKVLIVLLLFLLNTLFAKNQIVALYRFVKIIEFLTVFLIGRDLFKKINKKTVLLSLLLIGCFQIFLVVYQLVFKQSFQGLFYFFGERLLNLSIPGIAKASLNGVELLRPYGTFSHPNSLAGFFLLLYFFVLINNRFKNYFFLKYSVLLIYSILIFLSFSKVAIITLILLNTLFYLSNKKIKCFSCMVTRIIIPVMISLVFLQATTDPLTVSKRIELIKNAFIIIKDNLLFGVGLGNYLIVQSGIPSKFPLFINQPVHNIFLLFISETGIFVAAVILYYFFIFFKKNPFIFLAVILTGFFDHYWLTLQQNFLLLAFIYGSVSISFFVDRFNFKS